MDLFEQLAARSCVFIKYDWPDALPCRLDGRRESCGPCADHDHIIAFCLHLQDLLYWRYTVLGLYPHPAL